MQAVKLCSNEIVQYLTWGVPADTGWLYNGHKTIAVVTTPSHSLQVIRRSSQVMGQPQQQNTDAMSKLGCERQLLSI